MEEVGCDMGRCEECGAERREGWGVGKREERKVGGGDCGRLAEEGGGGGVTV